MGCVVVLQHCKSSESLRCQEMTQLHMAAC